MGKNDDKTEKPSAKRKQKARKKGQVAKSKEVSGWIVALAGTMLVPVLLRTGETRLTDLFGRVANVMTAPSPAGAMGVLQSGLGDVLSLVLPVAGAAAVLSILVDVTQTGGLISLEAAKPKFDRVNPVAGLKRLFSTQSLWQLIKQALKISVLVLIAYKVLFGLGEKLVGTQPVDMTPVVSYAGSTMLGLVRDVAFVGLLLALVDYAVQRHRHNKSLKMTKREVKDESRQSDGDPLIKREVRRKQMRLSRARMMAAIAGADVVITNPTHFAVALRYQAGRGHAPQVVAKGADDVALRIRAEASRHGVPIIEDRPLAQAIYAACEIDSFVPRELYVAVARVLAFVFTLPAVVKSSGKVHQRPTSALVA
ncbi:MAG TPA: flagellar biosynthesis protein FlhB [Acidimicrobiales bacterium]|nr:flagellar biosynthesis protein FlhB [Acidimicrobiales bacterium]